MEVARKHGTVARSQDLGNSAILLAAIVVFFFYGEELFGSMKALYERSLSGLHTIDLSEEGVVNAGWALAWTMAVMTLPFFLGVIVVGLATGFLQVGFYFTFSTMELRLNRLNPITGIARLVNLRNLVRLVASIFKLAVIGTVLYLTLIADLDQIFLVVDASVLELISFLGGSMFRLALRTAIALLVLALLDYAYQRWQYEKDLRMSKGEVKDELKMFEGDPRVKMRRRQIQIQLARQRMLGAVREADVIVTNPTELAVAVSYKSDMRAPKVVAKGAGIFARRIREIGIESAIPIVQKRDLAQNLYRNCDVGQEVPEDLWQAIAEILAYVYHLGKSSAML
jgi:flagellar biosynthetic protein FlhB